MTQRPAPDTDGNYGRLQAIDLNTKKTLWTTRQHAPMTTAVLATAGGLIFAGSYDREFAAFNEQTGERLWRVPLASLPSASPITYAANGKQYIAVMSGDPSLGSASIGATVADILTPKSGGSQVTVFEVP